MRIAVVHFEQAPPESRARSAIVAAIDANEQHLLELVERAATDGAELIVTPELPIVPHARAQAPLQHSSRPADAASSRRFAWWFATERAPRFVERLRNEIVERHGCHVAT